MQLKYGEQAAFFYGVLYLLIGGFIIFYSEKLANAFASRIFSSTCSPEALALGQILPAAMNSACHTTELTFIVFVAGAIVVAAGIVSIISGLKK